MSFVDRNMSKLILPKDLVDETWERIDVIVSDIKDKAKEWIVRSFDDEDYNDCGLDIGNEDDDDLCDDTVDYREVRDYVYDDIDEFLESFRGDDEAEKAISYLYKIFNEIESKIFVSDVTGLEECIKELFYENEHTKFDCSEYWDELEDLLDILKVNDASVIYIPKKAEIYIPELIISANKQLFLALSRERTLLHKLPPRIFEEIIAEIFRNRGFSVELTKQTRDGGKDIIALNNILGIETKIIIECKRYSLENKVGLSYVQRLLGVKHAERAHKAILATSSFFTDDALTFQRSNFWDLDLKDFNDVMQWIDNYNVTYIK